MRLRGNPAITITQAKALLGDESLKMTDEEIQKLIDDLDIIAQYTIGLVQKFKEKESKTDK